jgi:hypothetical protein
MIYESDTDLVRVWSGSAWVETSSMLTKAPRGIVAVSTVTTNTSYLNAETTRTSVSFTAVANRYYKIGFFEPNLSNAQNNTSLFYLRLDAAGGTLLSSYNFAFLAGYNQVLNLQYVGTFAAGTRTIFARGSTNAGTATVGNSSATQPCFLTVEDIGAV